MKQWKALSGLLKAKPKMRAKTPKRTRQSILLQRINIFAFVAFIASLILLVLQSIFSNFGWDFLSSYHTYMIIPTITFGILALWLNKDKIALNSEAKKEQLRKVEMGKEFEQKLSKISRIPLLKWFIRWMYEEGWVYSIGLILLIVVGFGLRIWNLGVPSFGDDELATAYVAKGFADTGSFILPSGIGYDSYHLDILFRALSIDLLGFNEFASRFPSVIFGCLTIGSAYCLCKNLGSKNAALISAFIICFLPLEISWSREARMYATFQLFYLSLLYVTYLSLTQYKKAKWHILALIMLIATLLVHPLGITFLAVPYCWVLLKFLQKRQLKRGLAMLFGALALCLLLFLYYEKLPLSWSITIEPFRDAGLLNFLLNYYAPLAAIGVLGMLCLFLSKNKLGMFIAISFIIPFVILSCFLGWPNAQYIYFLMPLLVITSSFMLVYLGHLTTHIFRNKKYTTMLSIFILVIFLLAVIQFGYTFQIPQTSVIDRSEVTALNSMAHPDWKGLKGQLPDLAEADGVIIGTNELGNLYYFGRNEYSVRREETMLPIYYYEDKQGVLREIYSGSIWIKNYAEFVSVIERSSAYLIVDHRFSSYHIPEEIINYVEENGVLVGSKGELKVYFLKQRL